MELQYDSLAESFCFGICNTQWEALLSKQVNYNQVVVKCQTLQECFLQNFKYKNFTIWNIQIQGLFKDFQELSRTFKGLEFFSPNSRTFKDFSRTL